MSGAGSLRRGVSFSLLALVFAAAWLLTGAAQGQDAPTAASWTQTTPWPIGQLVVSPQGIALYGSDRSTVLHAVDGSTGRTLWEHDVGNALWSPPSLDESTAYLAPNGQSIWALRLETGERLWWQGPRFPDPPRFPNALRTPSLNRAPPTAWEHGVVCVSLDGIFSLLTEKGEVVYSRALLKGGERDRFWPRPVVSGDTAYLATTAGHLFTVGITTENVTRSDLSPPSKAYPGGRAVFADPMLSGQHLIVASVGGHIQGIPLTPTARAWARRLNPGRSMSAAGRVILTPVAGPAHSLIAATRTRLYCLAEETGEILWSRPFLQGISGPPAYSPQVGVVVASEDGQLHQIAPQDGQPWGSHALGSPATAGPVIFDTTVLVATADSRLMALNLTAPAAR